MSFSKIAILGPGLLGGSVGFAALAAGFEVVLWGRKRERVELAKRAGLAATTNLSEAVSGADLVVFAVPVGIIGELAGKIAGELKEGALVTDVGSVKALPHEAAAALPFIGSHPMAGSEQTGIEAAKAGLLEGAACVVTNEGQRSDGEVLEIQQFWEALGCRVYRMSVDDHDRAVARISHLPHAMAVATAGAALRVPSDGELAAGGFRDTTRVASGDPSMWAEIMMENRNALTLALEDARKEMGEMLEHLANSDKKGLQEYLAKVKLQKETSTISNE